jgi:hypothetical protein
MCPRQATLACLGIGLWMASSQVVSATPITLIAGGTLQFVPSETGPTDKFDLDGAAYRVVVVADTNAAPVLIQTDDSTFWHARYVPNSYTIYITDRPNSAPDLVIVRPVYWGDVGSGLLLTDNRIIQSGKSEEFTLAGSGGGAD